ncbi:OPT family oligopeptide transporter [Pseudomonadota bacterium]
MVSDKKGLDPKAYTILEEGEQYQPYVSAEESPAEFTLKSIVLGVLFGIIFGAANAYLGLRAGLTISTSIPVAVMTVAVFRALQRTGIHSTILEANIAQTTGSASSSLASGIIFTLPALFMWNMAPGLLQMTVLAMSGGLLGVLFMIPLRRYLIEREHGKLPYPEGMACAEVLVANEVGGSRARNIFIGIGMGAFFKLLTSWLHLIPGHATLTIPFIKKAQVGFDMSAALFGVGYILGRRVALIMVGGGLLSALIIIPAIAYWGDAREVPFYPETLNLIRDMPVSDIWSRYVRYIGAGAVAAAGIITLIRSLPVMVHSFKASARQLSNRTGDEKAVAVPRTQQDLSLKTVGIGVLLIVLFLGFGPWAFGNVGDVGVRLAAALCVTVFAFFFVTVAARIVGLVGVTSNPTSGMTIAALLGTATESNHQRVIKLKGSQNTRDIGGYETDIGQRVRWGKVFRSDNLSRLMPEDFQRLESMGLKTVIDLRTTREVEKAPTVWQGDNPPEIFHYAIGKSDGEWVREQSQLIRKGRFKPSDTLDLYVKAYELLPTVGQESYQNLLELLLDESNWPLLIHCTAGKDRTGIAVALIFEILGVDRKTIMEDYLLTNEVARTWEQASKLADQHASKRTSTGSFMNSFRPPGADAWFPLVGVAPEMLNGFYERVEEDYGSVDAYIASLGVDHVQREKLKRVLTESD